MLIPSPHPPPFCNCLFVEFSTYEIFGLNQMCHYNLVWIDESAFQKGCIHSYLYQKFWKMPVFFLLCRRRSSECHPHNTWFIDYFALKSLERRRMQDGRSDPPFYSWRQEIKLPCERCPFCTRRKEDVLITKDTELRQKEICTHRPCSNNSYLPLASLYCLVTFHMEKEMAIHSDILAWRIPWTEEPGGLQSMGWQRVRHNWATEPLFTIASFFCGLI